jgi:hypothetical protein
MSDEQFTNVYVYTEEWPIKSDAMSGKPLLWPVNIEPQEPKPIYAVKDTYRDHMNNWFTREFSPDTVANNLLDTHEFAKFGLIRLKGPVPTSEERRRSLMLAISQAVYVLRDWHGNYELAKTRGHGGVRPGEGALIAAKILNKHAKKSLQALGLPQNILELIQVSSGEVGEVDLDVLDLNLDLKTPLERVAAQNAAASSGAPTQLPI